MVRGLLRGAAVVVVLFAVLVGLMWAFQRQLIYLSDGRPVPAVDSVLPGAREVVLETEDGLELGAWFLPADREAAAQAAPPPVVLVANGNAGHRGLRAPLARALNERGLSVLLFDYRGYGGNPGSPSGAGLARDVRAARQFLLDDEGVPPERLLYFGESLGAAVVTELAVEHPPAGLVLRSPFVDLAAMGRVHYPFLPVRALLREDYPVADQAARVPAPITVVYGSADSVVPPEQSRQVAEAARRLHDVVEVPGADHNDRVLLDGEELVEAVVDLAEHVTP